MIEGSVNSRFQIQRVGFSGEHVRVEQLEHGVLKLVLARPELRNAFNAAMVAELTQALLELMALPACELRVLLVVGEGKAFCAGADLDYMQAQAAHSREENLADARLLGAIFHLLASFPAPVVCGVQGAAVGGGFGLAACADVVVAEADAIFALSEVRLGIIPALISPYVVRKVGIAQAGPLMLSGRRLGAAEAKACGLVHVLVSPEATLEQSLEAQITELLQAGPEAARRTKALLLKAAPLPDSDWMEYTARAIAETRSTEEAQAGLRSFFAKTPAPWTVTP